MGWGNDGWVQEAGWYRKKAAGGAAPTQVRVTFKADAGGSTLLTNAAIGIQAGAGNAWDTTATPVELLFSAAHGAAPTAGTTIASDWANLAASSSAGTVASRTPVSSESGWGAAGGYSIRVVVNPITGGSPIVVIMDLDPASSLLTYVDGAGSDNAYYKVDRSYNAATPSGYTTIANRCYSVVLIETQ